MKNLNIVLLAFLILSFGCKSTKNYTFKINEIDDKKSVSDETLLLIDLECDDSISGQSESLQTSNLTNELVSLVSNIPSYINQYLEKQKAKYTATFKAKNSLKEEVCINDSCLCLPKLTLKQNFIKKSKEFDSVEALKIVLKPHLLQSKFLSFTVDSLHVDYSRAKLTKNYPIVNLLIEIKATTIDTTKIKKEIAAKPMIIPIKVGDKEWFKKEKYSSYFSDTFPTEGILDFEVTVTQINPKKVKIEVFQNTLKNNNEDLSNLFKAISDTLKE